MTLIHLDAHKVKPLRVGACHGE
jgi:hypothetical protein